MSEPSNVDLPDWEFLQSDQAEQLLVEFRRELPMRHVLSESKICIRARGVDDSDDLLLEVGENRRTFAVVHRTHRMEVDPGSPQVTFYSSVQELSSRRPVVKIKPAGHSTPRRSLPVWQIALVAGVVTALGQFGFPCTGLPLLSVSAGFVAGACGGAGITLLARAMWSAALPLVVLGAIAGGVAFISHLCG